MKKLLIALLFPCVAFSNPQTLLTNYQATWESNIKYTVSPIAGTNVNQAPEIVYDNTIYIANGLYQPTTGVTPDIDPAWDILSTESGNILPPLASSYLFVGNAQNTPVAVPMSGAISINNTGLTSANASSFFTTPTNGINNVLTGGQSRYAASNFGIINGGANAQVTVTYGTPFTNNIYTLNVTLIESTTAVPLAVKVLSQTKSATQVIIYNLNPTTPTSGSGTVEINAIGN